MPATLVYTSALSTFTGNSSSAGARISLTGANTPPAGASIIVKAATYRSASDNSPHISSVSSKKVSDSTTINSWGMRVQQNVGTARAIAHIFAAHNVQGVETHVDLAITAADSNTIVSWHVEVWTGLSATPNDVAVGASTAADGNNATTASVSSGTLAQAEEVLVSVATAPYCWEWNSGGAAPSGWTLSRQSATQVTAGLPIMSAYRTVSATTAVSVSNTAADGAEGHAVALASFKVGGTSLRIRIPVSELESGLTLNASTGWLITCAANDPSGGDITETYTNRSAEASGNVFLIPLSSNPQGWTAGTVLNCTGYQPSGTMAIAGYIKGTVEAY